MRPLKRADVENWLLPQETPHIRHKIRRSALHFVGVCQTRGCQQTRSSITRPRYLYDVTGCVLRALSQRSGWEREIHFRGENTSMSVSSEYTWRPCSRMYLVVQFRHSEGPPELESPDGLFISTIVRPYRHRQPC